MPAEPIPQQSQHDYGPPLLIDVAEVARLTSLSQRSVWRAADSGRMPRPLKVGGRRLWRRSDIEKWIEGGCPKLAGG